MSRAEEIRVKLETAFQPSHLEIRNDSARHAGHGGDDGSGESHFHVVLRAPELAGQSRIARHRAVHKALGPDLVSAIHALSLDLDG
ncbi:BolA family protein [Mameliella sediminis]|uniref:BolA family protein n=1 Tax=Mameliella sediminis TaxID=2836866 RepID=UPI001C48A66C|nr:BolA family protein [Mameliella sediminis]MBY6116448.1 BolA family transcriptional regulator [Antarctobacter heliothermus]MBY6145526.1 BolA family transcriptional regulator [Mameliella alba]MBV7393750.1 BolA family transcriptional regulator [Mameliella sediminis]MBY6160850.1 BolA family transcriptional regulator [Mameliella alba]MBY6169320.1 BolA family transcriptional regulator [Mameliella alba]